MKHLSYTPDRDEREFESFVLELQHEHGLSFEIPKLNDAAMKAKDLFPGNTFYLKFRQVKKSTALFFPPSFDPAKQAHLLFYFHGPSKEIPGTPASIKEYLNSTAKDGSLDIRQHIISSRQNVILVAPTLAPGSKAGALLKKKEWDFFVTDVKDGIDEYIFKAKFPGQKMISGKTILAAHSHAGGPLLSIALHSGADEIWGFNSIYQGGNYSGNGKNEGWPNVAEKFSGTKLYFYFTRKDGRMKKAINNICCLKYTPPADKFKALKLIDASEEENFSILKNRMAQRLAALSGANDSSVIYHCEQGFVPPPPPPSPRVPQRSPRPEELKNINKRRYPQPSRESGYGTLLDEILNEVQYEGEDSDVSLGFRHAMVRNAEAEWNIVWRAGRLHESCDLVKDVMIQYYKEGLDKTQASAESLAKQARAGDIPWSATFISWIVRKTATEAGKDIGFKYATGHIQYMGAAATAAKDKTDNAFHAFPSDTTKPEVGDIICYKRKPGPKDKCGTACRHCDIVVKVNEKEKEVLVIGGNTEDHFGGSTESTVGKKRVPLNADGFLLDEKYINVLRYISK